MVSLLVFTLIFIPLALLIGVASGTIGYTAWGIVVPLVFVAFGFGVYEAIFLSVFIDLVDSFALIFIYGKKGHIEYKQVLFWSIFAIAGGIVGFYLSKMYLLQNQDMLEGSMGWFIMALATGFLYKGFTMKKQGKKGDPIICEDENADQIDIIPSKQKEKHFPPVISYLILVGGMFVSGALSGLIGIGSGMNFVLVFMIALGWNLHKSTGSGIFMMFIMMLFCSITFGINADIGFLWPFMIIAACFALTGTLLGCKFAFKLSEDMLNIMVGSVMMIAAVYATVQSFLLN